MIGTTAGGVGTPAADAFNDIFFGHDQFDHEVQRDIGCFQGVCLGDGAGEAVEQVAFLTVGLLQAVFDQTNDEVIGNQPARIHDFFRLDAEGGLCLDGRAQHIAGRNLRDAKFFGDEGCLGSFARSGWT